MCDQTTNNSYNKYSNCAEKLRGPLGASSSASGVPLEDVRLHQCVRLTRFEQDRTISFVPPDGDFELLSYRFDARHARPPIWIEAIIEHYRHSRIEYMLKACMRILRMYIL